MKRLAATITMSVFVLSLVSCSGGTVKKPMPETKPPIIEEEAQKPEPSDNAQSEKMEDKKETQKEEAQKEVLPKEEITVDINNIPADLSSEKIVYWMPGRNKEHKVPPLNAKFKNLLDKHGGYFVGNTEAQVIYLTFDEGYENGYTGEILDILKENGVKAAFFVTKPYIKGNQELVKRMVAEGHIVGNHTDKHPSMPDMPDERVIKELKDTADYFKEVTGSDMPGFYRPPMGEWSERTLYIANALGYKTILWSIAHKDWDPKNQPGREAAYQYIDTYYHNGAIILLHAVSKSNTEALGDIIKNLKSKGYRFAELTELK